ncbi:hypothetical protein [Herbidospora cretacea]|uniref:hypothetical protein n=1 Tax=Herbidospora cretacea TaxID=28444 RepID=UPI000A922152|nr:hypothetical protein [Herbidospora cretacea]
MDRRRLAAIGAGFAGAAALVAGPVATSAPADAAALPVETAPMVSTSRHDPPHHHKKHHHNNHHHHNKHHHHHH